MKKLLIFILLPLVLILGAGIGAAIVGIVPDFGLRVLLGLEDPVVVEKPLVPVVPSVPPPPMTPGGKEHAFVKTTDMVVTLRSSSDVPVTALFQFSLEITDNAARARIGPLTPYIRDAMNIYLSTLSATDISGVQGYHRVRNGLWKKLTALAEPGTFANIHILKMTLR